MTPNVLSCVRRSRFGQAQKEEGTLSVSIQLQGSWEVFCVLFAGSQEAWVSHVPCGAEEGMWRGPLPGECQGGHLRALPLLALKIHSCHSSVPCPLPVLAPHLSLVNHMSLVPYLSLSLIYPLPLICPLSSTYLSLSLICPCPSSVPCHSSVPCQSLIYP